MKTFSRKMVSFALITLCVSGTVSFLNIQQALADPASASQASDASGPNMNHPHTGPGSNFGFRSEEVITQTAALLGVDQTVITSALKDGKTLLQIAEGAGLTEDEYVEKLAAAIIASIDAKVTAGTLTQDQATQQKSNLTERLKRQIEGKGFDGPPGNANPQERKPQDNNAGTSNAPTITDRSAEANENTNLTDIQGHWAAKYIKNLVAKGVLQGDQNKRFHPDVTVTREELSAMIARSFHLTADASTANNFTDVSEDRWSYSSIQATKNYFNVQSDANGKIAFHPAEEANRADVAATLVKVLLEHNHSLSLMDEASANSLLQSKFKDAADIPASLRPYVATAVQNHLIEGDDQGNFAPAKTITRAEIATLLDRLLTNNTESNNSAN